MGGGPTQQTPRNALGTLKALFQALGFQLGKLVLAIPNICRYLLTALVDAMIEPLDRHCPWVWYSSIAFLMFCMGTIGIKRTCTKNN